MEYFYTVLYFYLSTWTEYFFHHCIYSQSKYSTPVPRYYASYIAQQESKNNIKCKE